MDESEPKAENQHKNRRFDPELLKKALRCDLDQYDMLKRCSDKKDMSEWNEWRKKHPNEDILLEGADFNKCHLVNAFLHQTLVLLPGQLDEAGLLIKGRVCLAGANFCDADLRGACLTRAHLEAARFASACLTDANLGAAMLRRAWLGLADLRNVNLNGSFLEHAWLVSSRLNGASISGAHLQGTLAWDAIVDGVTSISGCSLDHKTDFKGVALDVARIDPRTKQLLEYNIRRKNWEEWYKEHKRLKWLVKPFWLMSDYGLSTGRIVAVFFALAFAFAIIYYLCGRFAPPGIVDNLRIDRNEVAVAAWLVPLRTLYFSIVTMTTLGFGDMYANAHSIWGHILLSVQVILGYVLLAALVTRFAVLFTAGGPAGKFADDKKNKIRNAKHEIRDKLK